MPTYVSLINWTDQGIWNVRESVDRYEAAKEAGQGLGVTFKARTGRSALTTSS